MFLAREIRGKEFQMLTAHFEVIIASVVNSGSSIAGSGFHDEGFRFHAIYYESKNLYHDNSLRNIEKVNTLSKKRLFLSYQ